MRNYCSGLRALLVAALAINAIVLVGLITSRVPVHSASPAAFAPLVRVEAENTQLVTQEGQWQAIENASASGGMLLGNEAGSDAVLQLAFEGTTFQVIYRSAAGQGILAIEIDGAVFRTVDTNAVEATFSQASIDYLDDAPHRVRIYAAQGHIAVDAFEVSRLPVDETACDLQAVEAAKAHLRDLADQRASGVTAELAEAETQAALEYIALAERCYSELFPPPDGPPIKIDDGELTQIPGAPNAPNFVFFGGKWGDNPVRPSNGGAVTYGFMPTGVNLGSDGGTSLAITQLTGFGPCFYNEIRTSLAAWSTVTDIDFIEIADTGLPVNSANAPDIRFAAHAFANPTHLAHAYAPGQSYGGDVHFNIGYPWQCGGLGGIDIGIVALHEIGHSIGLGHEDDVAAIMNSIYNENIFTLQGDDVNGARAIYGTRSYLHQGTLSWNGQNIVALSPATEHRWLIPLPVAMDYYFEIDRLSGNLEVDAILKSDGGTPVASTTTTNGTSDFSVYSNAGYYYLHLKPRPGTGGTYRLIMRQGLPPAIATPRWDFTAQLGAQDWTATGNRLDHSSIGLAGWSLNMVSTRDPMLVSPVLGIPTTQWQFVEVTMTVSPSVPCTLARLYFNTSSATGVFAESRAVNSSILNNTEQTFYFDMRSNPAWTGTLRRLRLDPVNCASNGFGPLSLKSIAFAASATPGAATLLAPSGTISIGSPTFSWNKVFTAEFYYLYVTSNNTLAFHEWYHTASVCSTSTCQIQPAFDFRNNQSYTWYIMTYGSGQSGEWSAGKTFTISVTIPSTVELQTPLHQATVSGAVVSFSWRPQNVATWYELYISNASGRVFDQWYASRDTCLSLQGCTAKSPTLPNGTYTWYVRAFNSVGYGPWGSGRSFTIAVPIPATIQLQFPFTNFTLTTDLIPFRWSRDGMASWYELYIGAPTQAFHHQWYAAETICSANECEIPALTIPNGQYHWFVRGYGGAGYGPWGNGRAFSVAVPLPATIALLNPAANATINFEEVTFSWQRDNFANWYEVYIWTPSRLIHNAWHNRFDVCVSNTCTLGPIVVPNGSLFWAVRGYTVTGFGSWGSGRNATVAVSAPGAVIPTAPGPGGAVPGDHVILEWRRTPFASWYEVYIGTSTSAAHNQWVRASQICDATLCRYAIAEIVPQGTYLWAMRAYSIGGMGAWNAGQTIVILPPGVVE